MVNHHVRSHAVEAAIQDNDIRKAFGGFNKLNVTGADGSKILVNHGIDCSAAFLQVALQAANEADIRISIHKYLHINQLAQFWLSEDKDAFHHDDGAGFNAYRFMRAGVSLEIIDWLGNRIPVFQPLDVLDQQFGLEGVGMVVVDPQPLIHAHLILTAIVGIVRQKGNAIDADLTQDDLSQGGFSAAGTTRNPNHKWRRKAKHKRNYNRLGYNFADWRDNMSAKIIDGKAIAADIRQEVKRAVEARKAAGLPVPGLATVLVGENPASQVYVKNKHKACAEVGITSFGHVLPADASQEDVEAVVRDLNHDPKVNGILVQLPLPKGLDEEAVLSLIDINKDVDGFHPVNIGRLAQKGREPSFVSCTPAGCIVLLERSGAKLSGANAVVLGRSNIVGLPVALLLVKEDATVTICHSRTKDIPAICLNADVIVAAIGKPEFVKKDWVKPGAYVIDVGINRVDDPNSPKGSKLVGDVAFDEVSEVAGAITPVPGGVGPMTIAMLLQNTLHAAELADKNQL